MASLCGLELSESLSGKDLGPLLQKPNQKWESYAVTQVLRPGDGKPVMGRSVRGERWRYTEWNGGRDGLELYDHLRDSNEFNNLAKDPRHAETIARLRLVLEKRAQALPPKSPFNPARL